MVLRLHQHNIGYRADGPDTVTGWGCYSNQWC